MNIGDVLKPGGRGVIGTASKAGVVNMAVYAVPHLLDDVGDLHAGDAAPRVRLLDGDQEGVADRFAERLDVAGKRSDQADLDLFRMGGDGRRQCRKKKGE